MTKSTKKKALLITSIFYFSTSSLSFAMMTDEGMEFSRYPAILKESTLEEIYDIQETKSSRTASRTEYEMSTSPVKDQDYLGTCTSFAIGGGMESLFLGEGLKVSEAHFTVSAENLDDGKAGLSLAKGMKLAKDNGFVDQSLWKYTDYVKGLCLHHNVKYEDRKKDHNQKKLNSNVIIASPVYDDNVDHFKFKKVRRIYHDSRINVINRTMSEIVSPQLIPSSFSRYVDQIKSHIELNRAVVVSVPVWWKEDGIDAGWETGNIKVPSASSLVFLAQWLEKNAPAASKPKKKGWHAISLYGFNNTEDERNGFFHFKNSWGTVWGTKGYGTIPYTYIDRFAELSMYGVR